MKVLILRGAPGSGKTTFAKQWLAEVDDNSRVRISRDDVRKMLVDRYWPCDELLVSEIIKHTLVAAVQLGKDIVYDNMNLNQRESTLIRDVLGTFGKGQYEIEYKDFFIPIEQAIEQDKLREPEKQVGEAVIRRVYDRYSDILQLSD